MTQKRFNIEEAAQSYADMLKAWGYLGVTLHRYKNVFIVRFESCEVPA